MQSVFSLAHRARSVVCVLGLMSVPLFAQAPVVAPGWTAPSISSPAPFSAFCTLQNGDLVTFDGQFVDRWSGDGSVYLGSLGSLPNATFAGFALPTPDGSSVVLGETVLSGAGNLHRVNLASASIQHVASLPLVYDAEFAPSGKLLVSASTTGLDNDLLSVDVFTGVVTQVGQVSGPSGPLAVSPSGDLYYATQVYSFPPPAGSTSVVTWSAAQVANGGLNDANATLVAASFDGGSALAFDPIGGGVYLGETNFGLNVNRIRAVSPLSSPIVVDSTQYVNQFEILIGSYPASLAAYQPGSGINLRYSRGGFDIDRLTPARPALTVSGPGTMGMGQVNFQITGGPPAGVFQVTACPQSALLPTEVPIQLPTFLLHTTFNLSVTRRVATGFALDANGQGTFSIFNPGTLQGQWAFQFFAGEVFPDFLGSSNVVSF